MVGPGSGRESDMPKWFTRLIATALFIGAAWCAWNLGGYTVAPHTGVEVPQQSGNQQYVAPVPIEPDNESQGGWLITGGHISGSSITLYVKNTTKSSDPAYACAKQLTADDVVIAKTCGGAAEGSVDVDDTTESVFDIAIDKRTTHITAFAGKGSR